MSTEIADDSGEPTARVPRSAWRASNHLRRYMPLYVFGTVWALMLALLPTVTHNGSSNNNPFASAGVQSGASGPAGPGDAGSTVDTSSGAGATGPGGAPSAS